MWGSLLVVSRRLCGWRCWQPQSTSEYFSVVLSYGNILLEADSWLEIFFWKYSIGCSLESIFLSVKMAACQPRYICLYIYTWYHIMYRYQEILLICVWMRKLQNKENGWSGRVMAASVEIGGCCSTGEILASRDQRHGRCTNCGMLYIAHIKWILESIKL